MRRIFLGVLGLVIASLALPTHSYGTDDWEYLGVDLSANTVYANKGAMRKQGPIVWAQIYVVFPQAQNNAASVMFYMSADCKSKSYRVREFTVYDKDLNVLGEVRQGDAAQLIQGNEKAPFWNYLCNR